MIRKGNLAVFEGSGISPWSERDIWPILKVEISPKLGSNAHQTLWALHITKTKTTSCLTKI